MVSFSTWRAVYRVPWLRDNREAVRILRDMFYLLVALYRAEKFLEFTHLRYLYFKMIHSFAQYGQSDAKDTVNHLLRIPWFRENKQALYRLIASYNRIVGQIFENGEDIPSATAQARINRDMDAFFHAFKSLVHFDDRDEERINKLLKNRQVLDDMLKNLLQTLDY
ncbi:MAG: hypothetical protein GY703_22120 [Gammaproteobacteria bacterium]|nr:hypothetical protein [Gammaproteobacteria bacterium]